MATSPKSHSLQTTLLLQQRYRRHFLTADGRQNAISVGVVGIGLAALFIVDMRTFSHGFALYGRLLARLLLFLVTLGCVALTRRARWPKQQDLASKVWCFAMAAMLLFINQTRLPTNRSVGNLFGVGALICVLFFAMRGPIWPRALLSIAGVLMQLEELWNPQTGFPLALKFTASFALVGLSTVGAFSARSFEEQRRQRFVAERQAKAAQLALTVEKERAIETARARTAFLAAMSHEFRNPISAVVGLSELLLSAPTGAAFDSEYRKQVRTIRESAQALLTMLNDILDLAKIDAQKLTLSPVPFDLHRLLQSVVEMMKPSANAREIGLVLTVAAQVPQHVIGDDIRLRQVLVNLIANGIKFTERGEVGLQVTADLPEPGHAQIFFHVKDTGKGMTPEVLARLFRPFEQAEVGISRRYGGTGLGLSISKQLVEAMDGDIQVQSVAGKGSDFSFTVRLPVAELSQDPSLPAFPQPTSGDRVLRLLLVDDDAINRLVTSKLLRQLGHQVHVASNGEEAVAAVLQSQFDVVFMDLQMPKMDGIEAAQAIRERLHGRRLPFIIAMTASAVAEDRDACLHAGMYDFICKPMSLKDISVLLSRLVRESAPHSAGSLQSTRVDSGA